MTSSESEWESIGKLWRSAPVEVDAAPLRRIVRAHRRRLVLTTVGEAAMVIAAALLSVFVVRDGVAAWEIVWLATLWVFVAVAIVYAIRNRRGTWSTLGDSVADYVALTRLRAARQRQMVRFMCGFFVVEAIAVTAQLWWYDRFTLFAALLLGTSGVAVGVWCWIVLRRVKREMEIVREIV
jgi:hypothetical protein